jgi:hypothetical protein
MPRIVTDLDDDLYRAFIQALDEMPIAKGLRRLVRDFVERTEREAKEREAKR